jgi:dolichyl-phosphate beta-glucosyltransferase
MLDECTRFFENRIRKDRTYNYEVILVDDGSKDDTSKLGITYTRKLGTDKFRVLTLKQNRGKGGAVRLGMLRARGKTLLFADADGATKFEDLAKLEDKLHEMLDKPKDSVDDTDLAIVCGSRAHLEDESIAKRSLFRTFLMKGFHMCVSMFGASSVRDTQCGFKLMTRGAARICFKSLHIERWAFDVELIKIAEMVGIPVTEVAVRWHEVDGSKLDPLSASVQMFKDLFLLWLRYKLGVWQLAKQD